MDEEDGNLGSEEQGTAPMRGQGRVDPGYVPYTQEMTQGDDAHRAPLWLPAEPAPSFKTSKPPPNPKPSAPAGAPRTRSQRGGAAEQGAEAAAGASAGEGTATAAAAAPGSEGGSQPPKRGRGALSSKMSSFMQGFSAMLAGR